jgi:hypothetical protein
LTIGLDAVLSYASPYAVFENGVDAVVRQSVPDYMFALVLSCIHVGVLLVGAIFLLQRKGVRR